MSDFVKGFLSAAGGAIAFAIIIFLARRHPRSPVLDDLDYDNAHPDGWVNHFKEDKP
ncbi:hypothetical protein [Rhizobium sp. N122]|uniref:hypothetical protein n=1 Tax=Rhizobium sp. N122 TaxID=1764272 RepID=UPI00167E0244|nr:hypothetical protein [Rhizobium sp. N122]